MITITFCMMLILSFIIDTQIPVYIFVIAGILAVDEIATYFIGHADGMKDRKMRKIYKDYRRK